MSKIFLPAKNNFETFIAKDLFWVPMNTLGDSVYSSEEIESICNLEPEVKKDRIHNLYEAVQFFFISGFEYILDVKYVKIKGNEWEVHKTGEMAVKSNCGCCASLSAWLNFFIYDKYDETGYLTFSRPDGSGHVMNYIKQGQWFYTIDLTPYAMKNGIDVFEESGKRKDLIKNYNITGILLRCQDLTSFCKFYDKVQNYGGHKFLYFKHHTKEVSPMSVQEKNGVNILLFPENVNITKIYGTSERISYKYVKELKVD